MRNKKAILSELPVIVGITFLTVLFFLAFFLLLGKPEDSDKDVKKEFESLNQNIMLLSYLSTPVDVPGISNVADLIILTINDKKKHLPELQKNSEKILNPYFKLPYFWGIHVFDKNEKIILNIKQFGYRGNEIEIFEQDIPNLGKLPSHYTVKLIKWKD